MQQMWLWVNFKAGVWNSGPPGLMARAGVPYICSYLSGIMQRFNEVWKNFRKRGQGVSPPLSWITVWWSGRSGEGLSPFVSPGLPPEDVGLSPVAYLGGQGSPLNFPGPKWKPGLTASASLGAGRADPLLLPLQRSGQGWHRTTNQHPRCCNADFYLKPISVQGLESKLQWNSLRRMSFSSI